MGIQPITPSLAVDLMNSDPRASNPQVIFDKVLHCAERHPGIHFVAIATADVVSHLNPGSLHNVQVVAAQVTLWENKDLAELVADGMSVSMLHGLMLVKIGESDSLVSLNDTQEQVIAASRLLGTIKGLRGALTCQFPTLRKKSVEKMPFWAKLLKFHPFNYEVAWFTVLDLGATTEVTWKQLRAFGHMGRIYAQLLGNKQPRVALVSNGEEPTKGTKTLRDAHAAMTDIIGFQGYVEPNSMFFDACDVAVMDGFTGNLVLKAIEGISKLIFYLIRQEFERVNPLYLILLYPFSKRIKRLQAILYRIGGATIIGLNGTVIKIHNSANLEAISAGLDNAVMLTQLNLSLMMRNSQIPICRYTPTSPTSDE